MTATRGCTRRRLIDDRGRKTAADSSVHVLMCARAVVSGEPETGRASRWSEGGHVTNDTPAARLSRRPQTCVGGVTGQESDARASALSRSEKRGRQSAEGPVMQGVAARNRDAPAVHILPRDLFAAVRIIREAGFRALRYLSGSFEELVARGAGVAPRELRAHLWRARGGAEPLRQIMKESRAPSWPGWGSERDALAGALDAGERFHAAEVHAVKFVDFLMEALVFEAKTDEERVAEMADSGRVAGQGLGHGAGATLADSLFQLLSAAGWRGQALASDDARRVACAACMECLRNVGDAWLALGSRARELRLARCPRRGDTNIWMETVRRERRGSTGPGHSAHALALRRGSRAGGGP